LTFKRYFRKKVAIFAHFAMIFWKHRLFLCDVLYISTANFVLQCFDSVWLCSL